MDNIISSEQELHSKISQAKAEFNNILDFTLDPEKTDLYDFEKTLHKNLLKLGNELMQLHFNSLGAGDQGEEIVNNDGKVLKRYRKRKKNI